MKSNNFSEYSYRKVTVFFLYMCILIEGKAYKISKETERKGFYGWKADCHYN